MWPFIILIPCFFIFIYICSMKFFYFFFTFTSSIRKLMSSQYYFEFRLYKNHFFLFVFLLESIVNEIKKNITSLVSLTQFCSIRSSLIVHWSQDYHLATPLQNQGCLFLNINYPFLPSFKVRWQKYFWLCLLAYFYYFWIPIDILFLYKIFFTLPTLFWIEFLPSIFLH